jgi:hypothetical protein
VEPGGVAVFDLAGEEPADGLKSRVGVAGYLHSTRGTNVVRAVMVKEAPGANEAALALGQGAAYIHGPWPAQRHGPGREDLDLAGRFGCLAQHFPGDGFGVAHEDKRSPGAAGSGRQT